ncbi:uncharacterized protein LTR77_003457 [Saxophila tyrrhenica]|uniref:Uncharacterized protein n=1 Tax=Saxophila tyrrhenica TaxID=1690608 RepID=A0AAV9PGL8_9PEZI|nr:hypothetical protein LTR77_003457 [Saxophila tyrrhenica]
MSNQQPSGVWATANRQRQSQSASRTPQNRSNTASPNPQGAPSQPPMPDGGRTLQPASNVWTQRSSSAGGSNGQMGGDAGLQNDTGAGSFNAAEMKAFLAKDLGSTAVYKPAEAAGGARTGSAWGSKPGVMANGQPFFTQLAKQIATLEGGG